MHGYIYVYIYIAFYRSHYVPPPSMGTAKNSRSDASRRDETRRRYDDDAMDDDRDETTADADEDEDDVDRVERSNETRLDSIRDSLAPVRDETDETG